VVREEDGEGVGAPLDPGVEPRVVGAAEEEVPDGDGAAVDPGAEVEVVGEAAHETSPSSSATASAAGRARLDPDLAIVPPQLVAAHRWQPRALSIPESSRAGAAPERASDRSVARWPATTADTEDASVNQFGKSSTTDDVLEGVDLTGRRFVITGAATGLGRESARALAARGAQVTVLARSVERAAGAAAEIEALVPGAAIEPGVVDLADLSTVRAFADAYLATHDAVDVLINNAGVMACPFGRTADGFEMQFGTNHLGHFLLTARLMPALLQGQAPRVITLTSAGHSRSDVDLTDPNFETTPYSPWDAYGRSKTANALFARELARRAGPQGVLSFAVHPGGILTDLSRHLNRELIEDMAVFAKERAAKAGNPVGDDEQRGMGFELKTVEAGAATQVWAATTDDLAAHNGAYLADCGLGVLGADPGVNGFLPYLLDDDNAAALWDLSETLVGEPFTV
jgi:NAD(P)-dependent dehydrogenase (short-subunit alcohol dehydrogenase family)